MNLFLAVTDNDWFRYLRRHPELDEVNLWQPGGGRDFKALAPGEPFLFKLHSPDDFVVGGGFFAHATNVPASLAWDAFGEKNGAASRQEMLARIERYRPGKLSPQDDPAVGAIVLAQPFFFDELDWIPVPKDFKKKTVGKSYAVDAGEGRKLWERVVGLLRSLQPSAVPEPQREMFGERVRVRPRLGAGSFRLLITDLYERRCAISGEPALPVLEAAHIRPVAEGGQHRIDNGILLRSDLKTLFDRGYLTVTAEHRVRVSRRLAKEYGGGEAYAPFEGREIRLPASPEERPRGELLAWHAATVFRG